MKKIITLFERDYDGNRRVIDQVAHGSEWVIAGEGVATIKFDGTCCLVRDGKLYRRYDCKPGKQPPAGFEPSQDPDSITGHWPGWVPVGDGPEDKWHREAWECFLGERDGEQVTLGSYDRTYELVGPKIQGNPYRLTEHRLWPHGVMAIFPEPERTFAEIRCWLEKHPSEEGIVWHHPDGRMVKIKRRDFGLPWPLGESQGA